MSAGFSAPENQEMYQDLDFKLRLLAVLLLTKCVLIVCLLLMLVVGLLIMDVLSCRGTL